MSQITETFEYRNGKKLTIIRDSDEDILQKVGLKSLVACMFAYQRARAGASVFDKKDAGDEVTLDWTGDNLPVYHGGRRPSSAPTKADIKKAEDMQSYSDEELQERFAKWAELGVEASLEAMDAAEDVDMYLATRVKKVRLAWERKQDNQLF